MVEENDKSGWMPTMNLRWREAFEWGETGHNVNSRVLQQQWQKPIYSNPPIEGQDYEYERRDVPIAGTEE